ncbi:MAG: Cysteine desulfurase, SufS [Bacteroidota bacterium]|jgi:cysteine desulfurase/selenocysteine lyase
MSVLNVSNNTSAFAQRVRSDFPFLKRTINGKPCVYFDNAATTQKPQSVIDIVADFYTHHCANVHRGVHTLSQEATLMLEGARKKTADFIHASTDEIIFTSGTTASINMVANAFAERDLRGKSILVSRMEHHSNLLPWMELCKKKDIGLIVADFNENGELSLEQLKELFRSNDVALVCITHISNTLGTINPVEDICSIAHDYGAEVLIDGAQAVMHASPDMQKIPADYYCFGAHKMFGPSGVGVLFVRKEKVENFPVFHHGGGTITEVRLDHVSYASGPARLEAGTPNIEGIIGMGAAIDFINELGRDSILSHEQCLFDSAIKMLQEFPELKILGGAKNRCALISVYSPRFHPSDLGTLLDQQGIAIRTGHHCTQPLMQHFGIPGTARISFAAYNNAEEIEVLRQALKKSLRMLL